MGEVVVKIKNSIRNIYTGGYIGGILTEVATLFLLFFLLGDIFFFPLTGFIDQRVDPRIYSDFIFFLLAIIFILTVSSILTSWLTKFGGNVVSKLGRRVTGIAAAITIDFILIVALAIVVSDFVQIWSDRFIDLLASFELWQWEASNIRATKAQSLYIIMVLLFVRLRGWTRETAGRITQPIRDFFGERKMGIGGSSKFVGQLEEWKHRYKPGDFLLGTSLYDPDWRLGHKDDRHILTIGSPRSGKGRSAIIPNLITWPYSTIVIDPKGGNAAVTAARRGNGDDRVKWSLGQEVHVIDPFNINGKTAHFNPLSVLDPQSFTITEDIKIISEALVPSTNEQDSHWTQGARELLNMVIGHELTKPDYKTDPTLLDVRKSVTTLSESSLSEMLNNPNCGGLIERAAQRFSGGWDTNEVQNIKSGAASNTEWLDSEPMQIALSKTDFDLGDLKRTHKTLYLVLPTHYLDIHKRFLRLFINVTLDAVSKAPMGGNPVLFILDEFYALGRIDGIVTKAATLPEAGVKLWPIVQNIGQIKELYGQNMEGLLAGVGVLQVVGTNDQETEQWISSQFGNAAFQRTIGGQTNIAVSKLREPSEIGKDLARRKGKQFVKIAGENPMLLGRLLYDKHFVKLYWNKPPGRRGIFEPKEMDIKSIEDRRDRPKFVMPSMDEIINKKVPIFEELNLSTKGEKLTEKIRKTVKNKKPKQVETNKAKIDSMTELKNLIGLGTVKEQVERVAAVLKNAQQRQKEGKPVVSMSQHLVFTGNPGTGKTTVAKIIGKIYMEMGLLKKGHLVEANREKMVGGYVGQTAPKTQELINQAMNGILFIDEAYALSHPDNVNDFGAEAVTTLLDAMESNRDKLIVIAAGYSEEMDRFITSNPGLKSRFKTIINFPDYDSAELFQIYEGLCKSHDYSLAPPAKAKVKDWLSKTYETRDENFGNGRTVRNFFESCVELQSMRFNGIASQDINSDDLSRFEASDIPEWKEG